MKSERLKLPRGLGSLRHLRHSGTHVVAVNGSGASLLVERTGRKRVHVLDVMNVRSREVPIDSAAFSPDGSRLALLRPGVAAIDHPASVEIIDSATLKRVHRFELTQRAPYDVQWHPDERLFVTGAPTTIAYSPKGKVLTRIATEHAFVLSPSGTRCLIKVAEDEWLIRGLDETKGVKLEARDAVFADDDTVVYVREEKRDVDALGRADARTGKAKKLKTLPRVNSFAACGSRAVAIESGDRKVFALVVDLKDGQSKRSELQGAPSTTRVSVDANAAFVLVNWATTIHRLSFAER